MGDGACVTSEGLPGIWAEPSGGRCPQFPGHLPRWPASARSSQAFVDSGRPGPPGLPGEGSWGLREGRSAPPATTQSSSRGAAVRGELDDLGPPALDDHGPFIGFIGLQGPPCTAFQEVQLWAGVDSEQKLSGHPLAVHSPAPAPHPSPSRQGRCGLWEQRLRPLGRDHQALAAHELSFRGSPG